MKKYSSLVKYAFIFIAVIAIDRITKYWALVHAQERIRLNKFLSFEVVFNRGITWGLFHSQSNVMFYLVTALICAVMAWLVYFSYSRWKHHINIIGEVLTLAGATSNLIDRFYYGGVVDYIMLSIDAWNWPYFNIADVTIIIGILLMFVTTSHER